MKNYTRQQIIKQLHKIAEKDNCIFIGNYEKAKIPVEFKCNETGVIIKASWDNLKNRRKIPRRNSIEYHNKKLQLLCESLGFSLISKYKSYFDKVKYQCKKCNKYFSRLPSDITSCTFCNNKWESNKGINLKNVLKSPYEDYYLYFIYIPDYNCYKIGLYKKKYIKSRFNFKIDLLYIESLSLYKAFYKEQLIIDLFNKYKYQGEKFGGYTECFNSSVPIELILNKLRNTNIRSVKELINADFKTKNKNINNKT